MWIKTQTEIGKVQVQACPIWTTWIKTYQPCQLLYIWMPTDCNLTGSNCTCLQPSSCTFPKLIYDIWQKETLVFADEFRHRELCHSVTQTAGSSPCFWPVQDLPWALRYCNTPEAWQPGRWEFTYTLMFSHAYTVYINLIPPWESSIPTISILLMMVSLNQLYCV